MGLTGWAPPVNGILAQSPVSPSVASILAVSSPDQRARIERFCDLAYNIEVEVTPELAQGGRLRDFVYCWLGSHLRFWDERVQRFGRHSIPNDRLCCAAVDAGLAHQAPGAAEAWLSAQGAAVRVSFHAANIKLTTLPGGADGMASVVAGLQHMGSLVHYLGGEVARLREDQSKKDESLARIEGLLERAEARHSVNGGKSSSKLSSAHSNEEPLKTGECARDVEGDGSGGGGLDGVEPVACECGAPKKIANKFLGLCVSVIANKLQVDTTLTIGAMEVLCSTFRVTAIL